MITAPTIVAAIVLSLLTLSVPKKYFLLPYIVAACFVPADQRIIVADLDFTVLRILVVMGALRIVCGREHEPLRFNSFDKLVILWVAVGAVIYVLQWRTFRAVIFKCGTLFDAIGMYWVFRKSVGTLADVKRIGRMLAVCSLVMVVLVAVEWATGQNPFAVMGRVGTAVREGEYRCQASFPHSIMLGLFWATVIPFFVGLWKTENRAWVYMVATVAAVLIVIATRSSTPLLTMLFVFGLLTGFRCRQHGRGVVWCVLGITVALHIMMRAPVWHLIARMNVVGGSTGWHRYHLINEAVKNFSEWAILGTRQTAHWHPALWDITNQYILEGVRGGIITLILFVILLIRAVAKVGAASLRQISRGHQWLLWGICVSVLGHCISFFGVSYFGQIVLLLYMTFAIVGWVSSDPKALRIEEALTVYRLEHGKDPGRIDRHRQLEHARHPARLP